MQRTRPSKCERLLKLPNPRWRSGGVSMGDLAVFTPPADDSHLARSSQSKFRASHRQRVVTGESLSVLASTAAWIVIRTNNSPSRAVPATKAAKPQQAWAEHHTVAERAA